MRCVRPGCSGTYGAEGYCDECGRKAPAGAVPARASVPATPVSVATAPGSAPSATGRGSTRSSGRSRGASRGGLGAGLIELPRVPLRDPATAVMSDPKVSEERRYCSKCEEKVGRGRDGKPGRSEGFCPNCGTPFSFVPRLGAGDLVNDR
jgi:serine/threonine-protein kinase PknG